VGHIFSVDIPMPAHKFTSIGAALNRHDIMTVEEGKIAMVMPKLSCNLDDAIEGNLFKTPKAKVTFAHRLLSALAFLQDNGIVHRLEAFRGHGVIHVCLRSCSMTLCLLSRAGT
jgi:hypothetical protein